MNVPPTNADNRPDPEAIFGAIDFDRLTTVVVAVSGGSDSLALLFLLDDLRKARASFPSIVAVTIDHELRPESADEALYVAGLCKAAGLSHRVLNWTGPKPVSGISAKARDIRYALLCKAASEAGTDMVLTGHTLDDQNETFMMRSARGGERGLAGMAPATLLEREIWLIRPLLGITRERLRRYLRERGIEWRDDPSNTNPRYERVRVRDALQKHDRDGIQPLIAEKALKRQTLNSEAAALLQSCVTVFNGIRAEVKLERFRNCPDEAQYLAAGVLLSVLGGQPFLPSAEECAKVVRHLCETDISGRMSLGRCIIQRGKTIATIYREMRSIPEIVVEPDSSLIWDGRYRVSNATQKPVLIMAGGDAGLAFLKDGGIGDVHRASVKSSPMLISDGRIMAVPALKDHGNVPAGVVVVRHVALFDHILSGYDEILAASVAKLFGLQDYKRFSVNQIDKK
ncbi:tRNA lysidine(34) synthetase TilS [Phyllobacterium sp. OV277]|uniref:tRNA lysidine(34) synthetase TilS n=1 Tax=Phyllobacterium sp. OV277 TaxID=1882772 RepID=UPI0008841EA2|nr:tRNA lysidine(34) synthetase TilS [Phyllobacterium sp. OV277]SDO77651.1 tRNA(Ile)-lysidine synthase [Phyllobacterium sp. OV277]